MSRKFNIVDYDPEWNKLFIKEKNELETIFGDLVCSIHHVGSTAIKTTKTKPEIDILIVVKDDSGLSKYDEQMINLGYRVRGECLDTESGTPGRFYYSKAVNNQRTHKLHICKIGHFDIMDKLLFVKYLNEHSDQGKAYADLKQRLSEKYDYGDIAKYLKEKRVFIEHILEKARKEYADIEYNDIIE